MLTVINSNGAITEVDLDKYNKKELRIGRDGSQCDIVIADPIVSKVHGMIHLERSYLMYRDEDSSNGTFWENGGGRKLLSKRDGFVDIFDQTVLRIGNVNNPDEMVLLLYQNSDEREDWKRVSLDGQVVRIGRDPENQIVLRHPGVSKRHCMIIRKDNHTVLHDLRSANGVMVNGRAVSGNVELNDKDIIQILDYKLLYCNTCVYYHTVTSGISLRASHVNKIVGRGRKKKQILNDVSCEIRPNEFVAIIGGSGAGKTTLMNAISGFEQEFAGKVYCNNVDLVAQFQHLKNIIAFVPQQDIIYENLTLKRMLLYTAKLKMPGDTKKQEMEQRIEAVLKMVDLLEHQNTYIRKLSGGQKKRASIAVELLADPKLFFLDEPTSGLDPGTEKNLMETLSRLAKEQNKTIIMVTHTTQNLHLCDKIIFMGPGGRLCFCGNVQEAEAFYGTGNLVDIYNKIAEQPEYWQRRFGQSNQVGTFRNNVTDMHEKPIVSKRKKESALRQFGILAERYGELLWNDKQRLTLLLIQPFLIALLLNIVTDKNIFDIYESTKSMLFALSCSGIWIGMFDSIQEICKERVILKREYMANLKLPCYMLSKFMLQAVLGLVQSIILTFVFLNLIGKDVKGIFLSDFRLEVLLTMWLTVLASIAMGFIISAMVKSGDKAMAVAPFVLIVQLLFSGILFTLKGIGKKISYCTVSRWSVEALGSISRLNKLDLKMQADFPMLEHEAESFFKATGGHVIKVWLILLAMTIVLVAIGTVLLRNVAKDRR